MIIAAISGSGAATPAAGGRIAPAGDEQEKYDTDYSAALIASSGPSETSSRPASPWISKRSSRGIVQALMGGFIPGTKEGVGLLTYAIWYSNRQGYPASEKLPARLVVQRLFNPSGGYDPVINLGGIFAGILRLRSGCHRR